MHVPDNEADRGDGHDTDYATKQLEAYQMLRSLVAADPREARKNITLLLDAETPELQSLLFQAAAPGEGRVRHLIANAARSHPAKARVIENLYQWLETETDAFARRAIEETLRGSTRNIFGSNVKDKEDKGIPDLIARTYHHIAGQLRHEVRNSLLEMQTPLRELKAISESLPVNSSIRVSLDEQIRLARIGLRNTAVLVEFDTGDGSDYFIRRAVTLCEWLEMHASRYLETLINPPVFRIEATPKIRLTTIRANDYLLNLVFKNVWNNAMQAVGTPCTITARLTVSESKISILMIDNGSGFDTAAAEMAFQDPFSTKGAGRGRGLLEIDEAIRELGGSARLFLVAHNQYRLLLRFPLEVS